MCVKHTTLHSMTVAHPAAAECALAVSQAQSAPQRWSCSPEGRHLAGPVLVQTSCQPAVVYPQAFLAAAAAVDHLPTRGAGV